MRFVWVCMKNDVFSRACVYANADDTAHSERCFCFVSLVFGTLIKVGEV